MLEEERAKALANSERLQVEMQTLQEEFARLTAAHGSGLDAVERQLEEERRLREECARAIRSECAAAAEILKHTEESDRQTDVSNTEVLSSNASPKPPPAVALAGAAPVSAPAEAGAAMIQLAPWKSETSMNSKVVELEEELERLRKELQKYQKADSESSWSKVINSFMCTSR